jgi:ADP-ribose pyrophosphatase
MNYEEKTINKKHIYTGNVIAVDLLTVTLPNGKEATRDIVSHPGASVVIPLSNEGELYMVRQFRKPLESESLEIPAGKLDKGEDPFECAKRELKEETGLDAENVKHLISIHSTPGFCDEILHMYLATGLKEGTACTDEDEFLSVEKVHVNDLIQRVLSHEITDAKSIIGILLADKIMKGEI